MTHMFCKKFSLLRITVSDIQLLSDGRMDEGVDGQTAEADRVLYFKISQEKIHNVA